MTEQERLISSNNDINRSSQSDIQPVEEVGLNWWRDEISDTPSPASRKQRRDDLQD